MTAARQKAGVPLAEADTLARTAVRVAVASSPGAKASARGCRAAMRGKRWRWTAAPMPGRNSAVAVDGQKHGVGGGVPPNTGVEALTNGNTGNDAFVVDIGGIPHTLPPQIVSLQVA